MESKSGHGPATRYLRPGEFLFREGEAAKSMFLIRKGTIGIRKMKGQAYIEVARLFANEIVGELAFFDRSPRSAAAVALTEAEVLEISFDGLDKIYKTIPDYMKTIMAALAERLRKADDMIRRLQNQTVSEDEFVDPNATEGPSAAEVLAATDELSIEGQVEGTATTFDPKNPKSGSGT